MRNVRTGLVFALTTSCLLVDLRMAAAGEVERELACRRVLLAEQARVVRTGVRHIGHCALRLALAPASADTELMCALLRTPGEGLDRLDVRARRRIERRCDTFALEEASEACLREAIASDDSTRIAACATHAAHCIALRLVSAGVTGAAELLAANHPANLDFELGGLPGQTLAACITAAAPSTTTTLPGVTTTTTTLPAVTTTTTLLGPAPTTTLAPPVTTSLPEELPTTTTTTTTVPASPTTTTTLYEPAPTSTTTTLPEAATTTTVPEPPATTTTLPDPTTTTTTTPEPTTTSTTTTLVAAPPFLVITEFFANPAAQADTAGEYFEIANRGDAPTSLAGLRVHDLGTDSFTITESIVLDAKGYFVLARTATAAASVDYLYGSSMTLANSDDEIILSWNGVELDRIAYDSSWPIAAGAAAELDADRLDPVANDLAMNWCSASETLGNGDRGTPGTAGGSCGR